MLISENIDGVETMNSKLAMVLGALSAAAILGTGINVSASGDGDEIDSVLLTELQWSEIVRMAEECYGYGLDNDQIVEAIVSELEPSVGTNMHAQGVPDKDIFEIIELIGSIAAQRAEITECLNELRLEGARPHDIREIIDPAVRYYTMMLERLAEIVDRCGLSCVVPLK